MPDERVQKWTRWVEGPEAPIYKGVVTLYHRRQIWRKLQEILKELDPPDSAFWQYHLDIYAATQAVAVRRQRDQGTGVASLARLITEIRDDPRRITRDYWLSLWRDQDDLRFARSQWDKDYAGEVGVHLDPAIPSADLERLIGASAAVKAYVDKHIAHAEQGAAAAAVDLTLNQLDESIDVLGELFSRYLNLLTAAGMAFLEPVIQHDWLAPFRMAWIQPRPERRPPLSGS